ncbi:MAG: metallophosphoesterase [Sulfurifustaceae bacterium]
MRVFALSDVHIDYDANARWLAGLSRVDYQDDVLILAGDISDNVALLASCFETVAHRFKKVLYVPGNHDLWVIRDNPRRSSFDKFDLVRELALSFGLSLTPLRFDALDIVPLFGWYDYSFGMPSRELLDIWADYRACVWPCDVAGVAARFAEENAAALQVRGGNIISCSHFLPRIDLMPHYIPPDKRILYPVLGTSRLEAQLRALGSRIHVYGHSHVNRQVTIDGVRYINNAFGYPSETRITAKQLLCVWEQ